MNYEGWRLCFQSSEQAAQAAFHACIELQTQLAAVKAREELLRADAERMDWLGSQFVTVRIPLRYGSRECFMGSPEDDDGERIPWNIRAAIDAARAGKGE
jgi:hypothetical protein